MTSQDAERQELDRVVELLGRSTRPGRLLAYVGAKHFEQREEQLTEFNIATEVFGRSTKTFDPTHDAVVRVEAHRLRKKLREIYAQSGTPHGLQISLPAGSYAPKFLSAPTPELADDLAANDASAAARSSIPKRALYIAASVGAIAIAIAALGFALRDRPPSTQGAAPQLTASLTDSGARPETATLNEVHLMAGYTGSEVIDNSGVRWTPDRFFTGGGPWALDRGFIRGTTRPFLFANWRSGEFGYDIPLERGTYELRLFFVSPHKVGDEKLTSFGVSLNGKPLLTSFDVNVSARGADVAEEQVFKDVVPDEEGFVRLRFTNESGTPALSALELVPGTPRKLKPIRIITQPNSFVDHKGQRWRADDYFFNGFRSTERQTVTGTDDPELFSAERFGHFNYAIPVDARGRYTVVLHFAEFYFGTERQGGGGAGSRVFNVFCNGKTLLENFDIYKEAGSLRLVTKTFTNIKPSAQGKINLTFEPVVNNATVSGIEILDESV
jgi:hypothetical protein